MGDVPAAVLFDCDGVLVDSEPIVIGLLRDDLERHGLKLELDQVNEMFVGGTIYDDAQKACAMGAILPDNWAEQFYKQSYAALAAKVEAVPGVSALLDLLIAAGVKMAVGSNGPTAKMQITLGRTGLLDRLHPHIYSAQDLARSKPAPDVYLHAAAQLGVSPAHRVVIEDSVTGARAGKAAGMRCIGFAAEGQAADLAPHCDEVVHDMAALGIALNL